MKLLFIIPPSYFLKDQKVFPNLGLLIVAGSCKKAGYLVEVLDLNGFIDYKNIISSKLTNNYDYICTTSTSPQFPIVWDILTYIKTQSSSQKIILGGPHISLINASIKKGCNRLSYDFKQIKNLVDIIICGDGEKAILEAISSNKKVIDADDRTSNLFIKEDLDNYLPDRTLININSYNYLIDGYRASSIVSQRGCIFNCNFCGGRHTHFLKTYRCRSNTSIINEIKHLYYNYGYKGIMFFDDELSNNKNFYQLLQDLQQLQRDIKDNLYFRGFVKSEAITNDIAKEMYKAGFRWILSGFESASKRMLSNMNKSASIEDNNNCIEIARNNNLKIKALMSIGHPGESIDTIKETEDWIRKIRPEEVDYTILSVYPGTEYFDKATENNNLYVYTHPKSNDKLYQRPVNYFKDAEFYKGNNNYSCYIYTDYLTPNQIVKERNRLEETCSKF